MALVRVTELIFAMPRIRIGANYFYFMNTFTRIPGAAVEPVTRPDGLRWRFDALNIFRKPGRRSAASIHCCALVRRAHAGADHAVAWSSMNASNDSLSTRRTPE